MNGHRWRTLKTRFRRDCYNRRAVCWLCRRPIDYDAEPQSPLAFEADHYMPLSRSPELAYVYTNLRPSHSRCNRLRGDKLGSSVGWVQPSW